MIDPLFTIDLSINGEWQHAFSYSSIVECLRDDSLRTLLDGGHVTACVVYCDARKITALPEALISWERFVDNLISNSTTILRVRFG